MDATCGLDTKVRAHGLAHKRNVFYGSAAVGEARGSLYKVCAALNGEFACKLNLFVGEQATLDNYLEESATCVGSLGDGGNVSTYNVGVASFELADVNNHVDFLCTGGNHIGCLGCFGGGGHGTQREANNGAGLNIGTGESGCDARYPVAVNTDARGAVVLGLGNNSVNLLGRGVGFEQGVVHVFGELFAGEFHKGSPFCWCSAASLAPLA